MPISKRNWKDHQAPKPRKRESCSGSAGSELERVKKKHGRQRQAARCGKMPKTSSTWDHKQAPKKNENSTHQSTSRVYRNLEQRINNVMILGGVLKQSRNQSRKQGRVTGASVVLLLLLLLLLLPPPPLPITTEYLFYYYYHYLAWPGPSCGFSAKLASQPILEGDPSTSETTTSWQLDRCLCGERRELWDKAVARAQRRARPQPEHERQLRLQKEAVGSLWGCGVVLFWRGRKRKCKSKCHAAAMIL